MKNKYCNFHRVLVDNTCGLETSETFSCSSYHEGAKQLQEAVTCSTPILKLTGLIIGKENDKQNKVLYFVDRASRYNSLLMTNLSHFFISLFITSLYMFRASWCSSSGDRLVLIHHLVRLVCVGDCLVCRSGGTDIPSSHSHRLIIPDDVLIQFDLLMMSTVMLETCREV